MKKIGTIVASFALLLGLAGMLVPVTVSAADPQQTVCQTLGSNDDCTKQPKDGVSLNGVIKALINILSLVIGIVAVIMIMVSGFKYVTAGGDSSKITSAKNTLIYAVVGLIVAALAQIIVKFVLSKLD